MNYFELFEIPIQLKVDKKDLPRKYFDLSRKNHPDYFINENPETQAHALEISSLVNKAFKTFQNDDETIKYVLQLKGLLEEEEKYELPPDFLMEVLEINEQLMDMDETNDAKQGLQLTIDNLQSEIYRPVKETIENYKDGFTSETVFFLVVIFFYQ